MAGLKWCRLPWNYLMGPYSSKVLELSKSNWKRLIKNAHRSLEEKIARWETHQHNNGKKQGAQVSQTQDKNWIECGHEHLKSSPFLLTLSPCFLGILFCEGNIFFNWDTLHSLVPVCKFFQSFLFLQFTAECYVDVHAVYRSWKKNIHEIKQDHSKVQYKDYILLLRL